MLEGVVANIRNNLTVLSYNIYLHPPAGLLLFTQAIAVAILFAHLPMHSTYSDNLILLNFTAVTILGEEYSLLLLSLMELYPSVFTKRLWMDRDHFYPADSTRICVSLISREEVRSIL
jgi:hypothetical protein